MKKYVDDETFQGNLKRITEDGNTVPLMQKKLVSK